MADRSSASDLELIARDPWTPEEHQKMDRKITGRGQFAYNLPSESSYLSLSTLFSAVISGCGNKLTSTYTSDDLFELIENDPNIRQLMIEAWRSGNFRQLRLLKRFHGSPLPSTGYGPSEKSIMLAWNSPFKGTAATSLRKTIEAYLEVPDISRLTMIVNSSGMGKSRMVDELSKEIVTVPMCLRPSKVLGYPPADGELRQWILDPRSNDGRWAIALLYAVFDVTKKHLEEIATPSYDDRESRLRSMAHTFRLKMTKDQLFSFQNEYRTNFFKQVVEVANQISLHINVADLRAKAAELRNLIDPKESRGNPSHRPLVILAFDEAHALTSDSDDPIHQSKFVQLRRAMSDLGDFPFFTLLLSTAGKFHHFSSPTYLDPSVRIVKQILKPLPPIPETGFDQLAVKCREGTTLETVATNEFMCHLGRPLFGSMWDSMGPDENQSVLLNFARSKLISKPNVSAKLEEEGALACLAVRFPLEFRPVSMNHFRIEMTQVERHMRVCLAATAGFERVVTVVPSELFLAEAARMSFLSVRKKPVSYLAEHFDVWGVDKGERGELAAMLLIMAARDQASKASDSRIITVQAFMEALLNPDYHEGLRDAKPKVCQDAQAPGNFSSTFKKSRIWFNHFIRVYDEEVLKVDFLWKLAVRGIAVLCRPNREGIDIIIPFTYWDTTLARTNMSVILVQVKNDVSYKLSIRSVDFDNMDPVGLIFPTRSKDGHPPVIRLFFALASDKNGVLFRDISTQSPVGPEPVDADEETANSDEEEPDKELVFNHGQSFTSFDIWVAGISDESFGCIGKDEISDYQKLMRQTVRRMEAYDLHDEYCNPELNQERAQLRRITYPASQMGIDHFSQYIDLGSDQDGRKGDGHCCWNE